VRCALLKNQANDRALCAPSYKKTGQFHTRKDLPMTPQKLKKLRAELQWSQKDLGAALGLCRNTITKYEIGLLTIPRTVQLAVESLHGLRTTAFHQNRNSS
jgi:DNA-binding XRE family transcriptional regulator